MSLRRHLLPFLLLIASTSCTEGARAGRFPSQPLPPTVSVDRLAAFKGEHRLEAWAGDVLLKVYDIAIGAGGAGDKRYEGDRRTPEGSYLIDGRHESRRFHRFLHISYPNRQDRRDHRAARQRGEVPVGAGIGGDIGIHGESDQAVIRVLGTSIDWTAGCIAVSDAEVEELYRTVVPGAAIHIHP